MHKVKQLYWNKYNKIEYTRTNELIKRLSNVYTLKDVLTVSKLISIYEYVTVYNVKIKWSHP